MEILETVMPCTELIRLIPRLFNLTMEAGVHIMKFFRFDREVARLIPTFSSKNAYIARGVRTTSPTQIGCFYLEPGGVVGYHQAASDQLLLIVQGEGWVRAKGEERVAVRAGDAVFWTAGEWHETGTDTRLIALPIESEGLKPEQFMPKRASGDVTGS